MAEWLTRWTWYPMGSSRTASKPARSDHLLSLNTSSRRKSSNIWRFRKQNKIFSSCDGRVVKALDLKTNGIFRHVRNLLTANIFCRWKKGTANRIQAENNGSERRKLRTLVVREQKVRINESSRKNIVKQLMFPEFIRVPSCEGRMVKALDLKSKGILMRRFGKCSQWPLFWIWRRVVTANRILAENNGSERRKLTTMAVHKQKVRSNKNSRNNIV